MSRRDKLRKNYIELKNQTAPDLWNRIEAGLEPKILIEAVPAPEYRRPVFRYYKPAAALASLAVIWISIHMFSIMQRSNVSEITGAAGMAAETTAAETTAAEADMAAATAAAEVETAAATTAAAEDMAAAELETAAVSGRKTETRFVSYQSLSLARTVGKTIPVPISQVENPAAYGDGAVYFSEDILADTELLCQAVVQAVSYETNENGAARALNYEIVIDKILFSEDYTTEQETIIVKGPIIENDTGMDAPLYALMENRSYVLPLKKQNGDYWLVFPFAPQIEVTLNDEFVFHNGWKSLVNDSAYVVLNSPAGMQDYYYDRMFLRTDKHVLTELAVITEEKHQDKRK